MCGKRHGESSDACRAVGSAAIVVCLRDANAECAGVRLRPAFALGCFLDMAEFRRFHDAGCGTRMRYWAEVRLRPAMIWDARAKRSISYLRPSTTRMPCARGFGPARMVPSIPP